MVERFSDQFLDDIRARLPVSALIGEKFKLRREGREFRAIDDPSLTVNDTKGIWHDFTKDKGGDIFAWFVESEGLTFPEAVERCAERAGLSLPDGDRPDHRRVHGTARNGRTDEDDVPGPDREQPGERRQGRDRAAGGAKTKRTISAVYDYTDADGALIYQVVRFSLGDGKKSFGQRRPAPGEAGVWIWGLGAGEFMRKRPGDDWIGFDAKRFEDWKFTERRVFEDEVAHGLYRLPDLLEEMRDGRTIWLPEGEKDAETLWDWGLPASTNSGGAKNWQDYHAAMFAGADVVIPVDNDKAGRERGEKIAASLKPHARRVRVFDLVRFWPDIRDKEDVTDWKERGAGTVEQLLGFLRQVPDWTPAPFQSRFGAVPFEHLDDPGPEHHYVVDGWFTVGDKSIIGGPSKSGKSFLAIDSSMAIARGTDFFGAKVMAPGLVVYQAGEGARGIKKRLRAYRQYHGIQKTERVPFVLLQSKVDLYRADGDTPALIEEIKAISAMYDVPLRAVFIDTLATATGGADENSGKDMSVVMANVDRISAAFGCHVCLVHHLNAAGTKLRGHSSIFNNIDQAIFVTRDEATKVRTAVLDKQKDDEDGLSIRFELLSVELGRRAEDQKPITSCVCVTVGEREMMKKKTAAAGFALKPQEEVFFRALMKAVADKGNAANEEQREAGAPADAVVVHYRDWRDAYKGVADPAADGEAQSDEAVRSFFKRWAVGLVKFDVIGWSRPWLWWKGRPIRGFPDTHPKPVEDRSQSGRWDAETEDSIPFGEGFDFGQ